MNTIKTLLSNKDLLYLWTRRTIKARYQQSVLGGLWAIIQPAATVAIFSIIFTYFVPVDTGGIPYVLFSFTAMVPWTLFSTSIADMVDSLVVNMNLVSKIYFPREVFPIASSLARLLDFTIALGVIALLMIYFQIRVYLPAIMLIPLVLLIQLALALGLGFIGAALNVFYRDIKHIFLLGLQIWFYASPIIYPVSTVPANLRPLYFLNPMAGVIEAYRDLLLHQRLPDPNLIVSALVASAILLFGFWFFKRVEFQFADVV
jgi:lipopolysaccharide transport system permease protein